MNFVHQDRDFRRLITIVAENTGISPALIEKDYWVTHALWSLHQTRLDTWLKGGTSLSKGFALTQRFSEDLDLRIEPGSAPGVPAVSSWKSQNKGPIAERKAFFEALARTIQVPQATTNMVDLDRSARAASYQIIYPGAFLIDLVPGMRPFVLMEVGAARVTPFVTIRLGSFVHEWLERSGQAASYADNQPGSVRCVHPAVTLIEKLDAISRRFRRQALDPASFIRHYEDAARIIDQWKQLPPRTPTAAELVHEMMAERQIAHRPAADDAAFVVTTSETWERLHAAHAAIGPMFWGSRTSLADACGMIRTWLRHELGA